jgi:hypothetical protein
MHHDLNPAQRARLAIYTDITQLETVVEHDTFDLLRVAHWVATGEPEAHAGACGAVHEADTSEFDLANSIADSATERPTPWRPAVN